jgi:NO-binding membrane sensor protein with MHYT domain
VGTVTVHNFSYGLLNPFLGYVMSCLGAFLGLRCVTRARAHTGSARAQWLALAAVALGATGIWAMHFIAMLGFTIPGQQILYNVPLTIASMLIAIAVVGIGLFIVGFGQGGPLPLITGGVIIGLGVASMHYMGMSAMSMPDSMHYNMPLFILSVVIAIVAGTAALWAGTRVRGIPATIGASLVMGVAVSGMHYTGMAAMRVQADTMTGMSGSTPISFIVPLLVGISLLTFTLTLVISLSPTEDEISADAVLQRRMETEFSGDRRSTPSASRAPAAGRPSGTGETSGAGGTPGTSAWTFRTGSPSGTGETSSAGGTPGTSAWTFRTGRPSGPDDPYRDGASAPDQGPVRLNGPRGGIAWSRPSQVRPDAGQQKADYRK